MTSMVLSSTCFSADTLVQNYNPDEVEKRFNEGVTLIKNGKEALNTRIEEMIDRLDTLPKFPVDDSRAGFTAMIEDAKSELKKYAEAKNAKIDQMLVDYMTIGYDENAMSYTENLNVSREAIRKYEEFASGCTGPCLNELQNVKDRYQKMYDNDYFAVIAKGEDNQLTQTMGQIDLYYKNAFLVDLNIIKGLFEITPMRERSWVDYSKAVEAYSKDKPQR